MAEMCECYSANMYFFPAVATLSSILLFWKLQTEIAFPIRASLTGGAQRTVLHLNCNLQFKCSPEKKKHDKRDVWTVNMGSKTLLAHKGS